jgi:hypothetical protein
MSRSVYKQACLLVRRYALATFRFAASTPEGRRVLGMNFGAQRRKDGRFRRCLPAALLATPALTIPGLCSAATRTRSFAVEWYEPAFYRPIADYYKGWAASGAIHELVTHVNRVGYWYALENQADYSSAGASETDAISTAYQLYLCPPS